MPQPPGGARQSPARVPHATAPTRCRRLRRRRPRRQVHAQNVAAVRGLYEGKTVVVDGNRDKHVVFKDIAGAISKLR